MSGETPSSPERKFQRKLWDMFNTYRDFMETQPVVPDEVYRQAVNEPVLYDENLNVVRPREVTKHIVTRKLNVYKIDAYLVPEHYNFETGETELPNVMVALYANDGLEITYAFQHLRGGQLDATLSAYASSHEPGGEPVMPDADLLRRLQASSVQAGDITDELLQAQNVREFLYRSGGEAYAPINQDDLDILKTALGLLRSRR
jgi:hypothetical protein